eukprot:31054-Rhodomonas_salina.1
MREKLLSYAEAYAAASLHTSPHTPLADTSAHTRYSEAGPTRAASGLGGWRCESGGGESRRARGPRGLQAPLAAQILDPVRATVVCDGPSQILALLKWFVEAGGRSVCPACLSCCCCCCWWWWCCAAVPLMLVIFSLGSGRWRVSFCAASLTSLRWFSRSLHSLWVRMVLDPGLGHAGSGCVSRDDSEVCLCVVCASVGSCGLPLVRVKNKFAMADSSEYDGSVPRRCNLCALLWCGVVCLFRACFSQLADSSQYDRSVPRHVSIESWCVLVCSLRLMTRVQPTTGSVN